VSFYKLFYCADLDAILHIISQKHKIASKSDGGESDFLFFLLLGVYLE